MTPRPAILLTVVYWAGLATGLLRFGNPLAVSLAAVALVWARRPWSLLVAAALLIGRLSGEVAAELERGQCAARWQPGLIRVTVRVLEPADRSGGRIALSPSAGCRGRVAARWPRGHAVSAGARAEVSGQWVPRVGLGGRMGGTLAVREVRITNRGPDGVGSRLHNYLFAASHRLYGTRAGMVDALILGRRGGIDPELQERFAKSGLVHLLSISGFHVGLITAWAFLLCRLGRMPRGRALGAAAAMSAGYVVFLGWPAPAARAATLAIVMARCRIGQRNVQPDALLAATCLVVLLVDPWSALDLGGWLSAAALWGASRFTRWSDRALGQSFWARTAASSLGATLATAPITATFIGTVSLAGLILNFPAIPLAALAVPGVLASLLLLPIWPAAAEALAAGSGLGLHLMELCAVAGAALPYSHVEVEPNTFAAFLPWALLLGLALWIIAEHNTAGEAGRRAGWCMAALLWAAMVRDLAPRSPDGDGNLTLHFLDVGQGDGAAIRTPGGRWVVVDAGPAGERSDAGRRVVVPFLERNGARSIAAVVVSHAHADHLGGVPAVMSRFPVGMVIEPGAPVGDAMYSAFLSRLDRDSVPWHPAHSGEAFRLDGVHFQILHPARGWSGWGEDVNEDSAVLLVRFGEFEALFTGDAGFPAEAMLAPAAGRIDLLKVGHHGSRGSTGGDLLDSLRPRAAVISVGRNEYGHPAPETLARLETRRIPVLRTDRDGAVRVVTDGRTMTISSLQGDQRYPVGREE